MKKKTKNITSILVTAGPTIEAIDPVRFISNRSTGEMGYAVARMAVNRGFKVILISGPVCLPSPEGVETIKVETTSEMKDKVSEKIQEVDCIVMTAAVCDFAPAQERTEKIKKSNKLILELVKTPDILKGIGKREGLVKVGFALETETGGAPQKKLEEKELDIVVSNIKNKENDPFGKGEKNFVLFGINNYSRVIKEATKEECAAVILDEAERVADERNRQ